MTTRLSIALFLIVTGFIAARQLSYPYSSIVFLCTAVGGYCVLLRKTRRVLLRIGALTWTREELCRHVLITGDTGTGKTSSGFNPMLHQITQKAPNWGGLVLGVKGDEPQFIRDLFTQYGRKSDIIELQVRPTDASTKWKPPHRYNLLSDRSIPWMTHAKYVVDTAASMTSGRQHPFFKPMAHQALAKTFELIDEHGYPVTLSRAYEVLTSRNLAAQLIKPFKKKSATRKQQKVASFFESTLTEVQAYEQKEGIQGTIQSYLGFLLDSDVAAVFSSDEPNTFSLSELDNGGVLTLEMPQALATERRYIQTYLKILLYSHCLRRFDKPGNERLDENLLLLVADEFQDIVTASKDGISDHKIIDRIRAANAAIIAGTQSQISVDPAIGERQREVLTLNFRTRIIFKSADDICATANANFIGKKTIWKKTKSSKPFGVATYSRRKEQEYYIKPSKLLRL